MSDIYLVRHCAPTLVGIKPGNRKGHPRCGCPWETIINLNPEYIFVLDRSTATGAADEGILGAQEVIENELIRELDCYKEGKIIYLIRHANVWYTSTGGVQALDTMLSDLETALLG